MVAREFKCAHDNIYVEQDQPLATITSPQCPTCGKEMKLVYRTAPISVGWQTARDS